MKIFRISSQLSRDKIIERCAEFNAVAVAKEYIFSKEQLFLAYFLTKNSFLKNKHIGKTFEMEFLLWLFGEREVKKVFEKNLFSPQDFYLVCFSNCSKSEVKKKFLAKFLALSLNSKISSLEIEKISLSRI